jgi:hypothetical protein
MGNPFLNLLIEPFEIIFRSFLEIWKTRLPYAPLNLPIMPPLLLSSNAVPSQTWFSTPKKN